MGITAVLGFTGATVADEDVQVEPRLVVVPCNPDQFLDKSELDTTICYGLVGDPTEAQMQTLMCNEAPAAAEAWDAPYCEQAEAIPEDEEPEHGIPQAEGPAEIE